MLQCSALFAGHLFCGFHSLTWGVYYLSVLYSYLACRLHGCDLFSQPVIFCFWYSERHANTIACGCSLDLWGSILSLLLLTDSCPFGIIPWNRFTLFLHFTFPYFTAYLGLGVRATWQAILEVLLEALFVFVYFSCCGRYHGIKTQKGHHYKSSKEASGEGSQSTPATFSPCRSYAHTTCWSSEHVPKIQIESNKKWKGYCNRIPALSSSCRPTLMLGVRTHLIPTRSTWHRWHDIAVKAYYSHSLMAWWTRLIYFPCLSLDPYPAHDLYLS